MISTTIKQVPSQWTWLILQSAKVVAASASTVKQVLSKKTQGQAQKWEQCSSCCHCHKASCFRTWVGYISNHQYGSHQTMGINLVPREQMLPQARKCQQWYNCCWCHKAISLRKKWPTPWSAYCGHWCHGHKASFIITCLDYHSSNTEEIRTAIVKLVPSKRMQSPAWKQQQCGTHRHCHKVSSLRPDATSPLKWKLDRCNCCSHCLNKLELPGCLCEFRWKVCTLDWHKNPT